jgi:GntR family transcriptional regulator
MTTWTVTDASILANAPAGPAAGTAQLVPLYRRISDDLLHGIAKHSLKPGDALPTESALCAAYRASRITIRKALDELVARNLVVRRRGSGTYLNDAGRIGKSVVLTGCLDDVLMLNRMTVLEEEWAPLPARLAEFVGTDPGPAFRRIVGLNHVEEGKPIVHIAFWFPPAIAERITVADIAGPLPTIRHVENAHGLRVDHADQVMAAVAAPAPVADTLGGPRGTPLLRAMRAYRAADGALIELFEAHYHPARYQFSATLLPRQG